MAHIVFDISKAGTFTVRPMRKDEIFGEPSRPAVLGFHYWVRTAFGNILYATGPDELGALVAMVGAIEHEAHFQLRTTLHSILQRLIEGFTISLPADGDMTKGFMQRPDGSQVVGFRDTADVLDKLSASAPRHPKS